MTLPLVARRENNKIVIEFSESDLADTVKYVLAEHIHLNPLEKQIIVTDKAVLADQVVQALNDDTGNDAGYNIVCEAVLRALTNVVDNGDDGLDIVAPGYPV